MEKVLDFIACSIKGKSIYRILFQQTLKDNNTFIVGKVLDIGSGPKPSYVKYLPKNIEHTKTDYYSHKDLSLSLDFNKPFNFPDETFDTVFLFHNIYIARNADFTLKESVRVLKKGGCLFISSPFSANEMPEPHDFVRFSKEGLDRMFFENKLETLYFKRIGDRFALCAYALHPLLYFSILRTVFGGLALFLDFLTPKKLKKNYPFPIGYFYVTRK